MKSLRARRLVILSGVLCLLAGMVPVWYHFHALPVPTFDQVRSRHRDSQRLLLDRYGEIIHETRVDARRRSLRWVPLEEVSPALKEAVLLAEDRRFYRHRGTDWRAFAASLAGLLKGSSNRGASTVTMQLASKLERTLQAGSSRRSLVQKLRQIRFARSLERGWSKEEILEAYLNLVTFRGELEGIAAASHGLYRKKPHGLESAEAAVLAALLKSPNASPELAARRAAALSALMNPVPAQREILRAAEALNSPYRIEPQMALAPHVARQLMDARSGQAALDPVESALDGALQRFAVETLGRQLRSLSRQNVHDGAVLIVDNSSGDVLAYVGNAGQLASARYVDGVRARRQAGSTLKPFLYGLAFDRRFLTPASLVDDSPLDLPLLNGIYRPENYDEQFRGLVTVRTALAASLNIPAVRTLNLIGVEDFVQLLGQFGVSDLRSADFYGPSLALGSADVSLWDLVKAYRALARGGVSGELRLAGRAGEPADSPRALTPGAAFLVSDILSDRESRSATFALENPLATRFWTAVKTGTSKDMRDNWCLGYSRHYTVGVWVGNFSGEPMWNVSGISGSAPVWVELMNWLHRDVPSSPPTPPPDLVASRVQFPTLLQSRKEWFLQGTESKQSLPAYSAHSGSRITYPVPGTLVALDPDIPSQQQRIFFEASLSRPGLRWSLNDVDQGPAGPTFSWRPRPGSHTIALVDESHEVVDSVKFAVRGGSAGLPAPDLPPRIGPGKSEVTRQQRE